MTSKHNTDFQDRQARTEELQTRTSKMYRYRGAISKEYGGPTSKDILSNSVGTTFRVCHILTLKKKHEFLIKFVFRCIFM